MSSDRRNSALAARVLVAFAVFFTSGAAGLIYQVAWSRLLALAIGVSIYAITAVICTFMAGLALGSWLIGRRAERWNDPLRVYGVLEGLIGLYALITPWLFEALQPIYAAGSHWVSGFGLQMFRVALSAFVLLLPTTLMGGTLPLLSRVVTEGDARTARSVGLLYGVNTFGAVVGCLLAGFVLLAALGIRATLFVAAAMNFGIAAAALLSPRLARSGAASPAAHPAFEAPSAATAGGFVLAIFFVSGFAALGYELLWTRALLVYVRASTYAFSLMLGVYLFGVALGSTLVSGRAGRTRRPLVGVALCNVGVAAAAILGLVVFPDVDRIAFGMLGVDRISSFGSAMALMFTQASVILLLPTIFMGAMLPFGIAAYHRASRGVGHSVGLLYAVNTAGNIAGSIIVGFAAIGLLGVRNSILVMVGLNLAVAAAVAIRVAERPLVRVAVPVLAGVALVATHLGVSQQIFYQSLKFAANSQIVFYREGATDTVAVVETRGPRRSRTLVYSDGRGAAGTRSLFSNLYFGHLPMLLNPDPKKALHICYGSGNSLMALTRHDPERIDMVELSPHVREASKYFWTNEGVVDDPRVNLIIEDGRNFLLGTEEKYDVVSLEPPNIFSAGVVNLYTRDFYELIRDHLQPGGIAVQWFPAATVDDEDFGHLLRAFTDAFPWVSVWQQLKTSQLLLVGKNEPLEIDMDRIRKQYDAYVPERDRKAMRLPTVEDFLSFFRLGDASTRRLAEPFVPVTDDRTIVDYSMPKFIGSGFGFFLYAYPLGPKGYNTFSPIGRRMRQYMDWRDPLSEIIPDADAAAAVERARDRIWASEPHERPAGKAAALGRAG